MLFPNDHFHSKKSSHHNHNIALSGEGAENRCSLRIFVKDCRGTLAPQILIDLAFWTSSSFWNSVYVISIRLQWRSWAKLSGSCYSFTWRITGPGKWTDYMTQLKFAIFLCVMSSYYNNNSRTGSSPGMFFLISNNNAQTEKISHTMD